MKLSLQWLNAYISPAILEAKVALEALIFLGHEVESVLRKGLEPCDQLVVGKVLKRDPHPNADRLSVCEVAIDAQGNTRSIVCGAQNYKVGDCVPVALPGATLPGGFTIKNAKLRGVASEGMLCSAQELGLQALSDGLLILENPPTLGTRMDTVLGQADTIFDVEITPNRPDCLSHCGIARELCAYLDRSLSLPQSPLLPQDAFGLIEGILVHSVPCQAYHLYRIENVTVNESPQWLKRHLEALGLRPINNVVDITNFVLQETGQPMHAFDAQKLNGHTLSVRFAHAGESLKLLNDEQKVLQANDLVIADASGPVALAGIMGGSSTQVDFNTKSIILEVAHFEPLNASTKRTESSYRFDRGVDPQGLRTAAARAVDLIRTLCSGQLKGMSLTQNTPAQTPQSIPLNTTFVRRHCGFDIPASTKYLEALAFRVENTAQPEGWRVHVPSFRQKDVTRPIDLVEEVLRLHGTQNIPEVNIPFPGIVQPENPELVQERALRTHAAAQGLWECFNDSFVSLSDLANIEHADCLALSNPINQEQTHMRPHLLYGLLKTLKTNTDHGNSAKGYFELGNCFLPQAPKTLQSFAGLGFVWVKDPLPPSWKTPTIPDFFDAKALMEQFLHILKTSGDWSVPETLGLWQAGHSAQVRSPSGVFGQVGLLNPLHLSRLGIQSLVLAGQIWIPEGCQTPSRPQAKALSPFPCVSKDLSLLVPQATPAQELTKTLRALTRSILEKMEKKFDIEAINLFDVYQGVSEGQKSLSFSLRFRSTTETLTSGAVQEVFEALIAALKTTPFSVRSGSL